MSLDVFLPALAGSPAALDFAVTDPQRQEASAGAAAAAYATHKAAYLNTAEHCRQNGIVFLPMVAETMGAWDDGALKSPACRDQLHLLPPRSEYGDPLSLLRRRSELAG